MNTPASSRGGRAGLKTTAQGLDRGDLRVQVRVRHELAAAWPTSIHCYGDLLARARHPSTPSRPRVCRRVSRATPVAVRPENLHAFGGDELSGSAVAPRPGQAVG